MSDIPAPSLFGGQSAAASHHHRPAAAAAPFPTLREADNLLDLLYDGFYMVFLLKNGYLPSDDDAFPDRIRSFLAATESGSKRLQTPVEDLYEAKFAFCALVDEVVLMSGLRIRDAWSRRPLQLQFFGEQLAGERFFEMLEKLRQAGAPKLQVLEVFHMCLLLGFQGRYILEGSEKLAYLTSRVGEEIAQIKGKRAVFAPHWSAPDRISNALRREVPLWVMGAVFGLVGLLAFSGMRWSLGQQTRHDLAAYSQIVKLAPQPAFITISLP